MKLHVYLRNLGIGSRRAAEALVSEGRVEVDGKIGTVGQIVEGSEHIRIDGHAISGQLSGEKSYILINKPAGYTSTTAQFFDNEHSVLEILPYEVRSKTQWQIVGRLDKNSEGLLLLTNNGDVSYTLTHPKFEVAKEYVVEVSGSISEHQQSVLKSGYQSPTGVTYTFKEIRQIGNSQYSIVLTEGKKREIREALGALQVHVLRLKRIKLGVLELGDLKEGEWRELNPSEVSELARYVERVKDAVLQKV
ncbi:MAG: pseudouridine synthase [Patescibacteria group bacterium]|jgi:23S rRNA pseudouridine2605 synthase